MGKIALRAYNQEIEALVDQNQIDQAIAHCRYLLKLYPKNVATYRVLGKAYLEARRYGESNDVFQRVLSAVPDDFVSHIGMSIIREDEGNLDAAIWHMERAFEVQPSNSIVQEELKRLYGRRDGMQPPKIRLTNGALVRMYFRGELYQQALAELRNTLAEDEQRIDLEIIQARILYQQGQRSEAAEICTKILSKLPFCLEANRIMHAILLDDARADEAMQYHQRVIELDPYAALLDEGQLYSQDVPDDAIMVEKIDLVPSTEEGERPSWMETAGVDTSPEDNLLPEWMDEPLPVHETSDSVPEETDGVQGIIQPLESPETPDEPEKSVQIPGDLDAVFPSREEVAPSSDNLIIPGEVPEWLRSFEPDVSTDHTPSENDPDAELEELADMLSMTSVEPDSPTESEVSSTPEESIPDQIFSGEGVDVQGEVEDYLAEDIPSISDELPDWLRELPGIDEIEPGENNVVPDWLEIEEDANHPSAESNLTNDNLIEISKVVGESGNVATEAPDIPENGEILPIVSVESREKGKSPDITASDDRELPTDGPAVEINGQSLDGDAAFAWLESLAAKQGADEGTLLSAADDLENLSPSWTPEEIGASGEDDQPAMRQEISDNGGINETEGVDDILFDGNSPEAELLIPDKGKISEEGIQQPGEIAESSETSLIDSLTIDGEENPSEPPKALPHAQEPATLDYENSSGDAIAEKHELPDWLKDLEVEAASKSDYSEFLPDDELPDMPHLESEENPSPMEIITEAKSEHDGLGSVDSSDGISEPVITTDLSSVNETLASDERIENARRALEENKILLSLETFREMIENNDRIDEVISIIKDALDRHPVDIDLWQSLGDAYAKIGEVQSAIDSYTKAEDLIK